MNANDIPLTQLLNGTKQFIVPIFQRDYSWGQKHCLQLWNDIVRVGRDEKVKGHFLGSVVYVAAADSSAGAPRWLVIDGQQRLTTITLLLVALRERLTQEPIDEIASPEELNDNFLLNRHGKDDRRYRLLLRRADHETLSALLDGKSIPKKSSERIVENVEFFRERMAEEEISLVYKGINKLLIVQVCLARGQDDPQMIFESLNSTGLDLTQADLIRNFVLMRQDEASQTSLYIDQWQPMEMLFGTRYRSEFDKFMRDYLALQLKPSKQFRSDQIYHQFRTFFYEASKTESVETILADIGRFASYYSRFSLGKEDHPKLQGPVRRLRQLVEVASSLVMRLYECHLHHKSLSADQLAEALELLESYVFRRTACDMQTRSLWQIFASMAYRIRNDTPLESLKVVLFRQGKNRRFPNDTEFRDAMETRDVYDMRNKLYLLDRLENDSKEQTDTSTLTIEHVMPQNETLNPDWQTMLGPDWKSVQEKWLHRLGNVTLTGYNSEYSDRSFQEKRTIQNGFNDSSVRLNKFIREQERWTEDEMEARGRMLAAKAVRIWPSLEVDMSAVRTAEIEERKQQASRYSIENLELTETAKKLFDALRPEILALGDDVLELFGPRTVVYRVFDFFLEVLPRKNRLTLMANIDFDEVDDPSNRAKDASDSTFLFYATESGDTLYRVNTPDQIALAMHVVKQAYARVTE